MEGRVSDAPELFVDWQDDFDNPPPAPLSLWGPVYENDIDILHSSEKMGKTMIGLNLAIAGARGDSHYLGFKIREGGFRTLLINGEVHRGVIAQRLRLIAATGRMPDRDRFRYNTAHMALSDAAQWARLTAMVEAWRPDLLILDPLADVFDADENSNTEMNREFKKLTVLRKRTGCTILLVHHDGKSSETNSNRAPHQRMRGANLIAAATDTILSMVPLSQKKAPVGRMHFRVRNGVTPDPIRVRLNGETLWFETYSEDQEFGEQLQKWLIEAGGILSAEELEVKASDAWNLKDVQRRTVKRRIKKAIGGGFIAESINDQQEPIYITNKITEDDE